MSLTQLNAAPMPFFPEPAAVSGVEPDAGGAVACAACGSSRISIIFADLGHDYSEAGEIRRWPYRLLRCRDCGLGFVDPSPTMAMANSFYTSAYGNYQAPPDEGDGPIPPLKRKVALWRMRTVRRKDPAALAETALGVLAETVTGKTVPAALGVPLQFPPDAALFDLGYGSGSWMESMSKLGYRNLHGYDIDANDANLARLAAQGFHLSSGDFLANDYPEAAFDCIRLSHVFEHLIDPVPVLIKCRRMLKPGGMITMSHPCIRSWIGALGFRFSPSLMLPKHLYHHTPRSTLLMLRKAGFVDIRVAPFSVASQFGAMVNNCRRHRSKPMIPAKLFLALAPLYRLFGLVTGRGDFMSAWAKAPARP